MTAERVADKVLERSRRGKWNGGPVPEGYIRNPETKGLEPSPEDSATIRRVFQMVTEIGSPSEVARMLNHQGIRTKRREQTSKGGAPRQVGGKPYIGARVTRIVENPIYKGIIRHRGVEYPAEHTAIVSEEEWAKANAALQAKSGPVQRITVARSNKHAQILKGLIHCDHCGYLLTPKASGKLDKHGNPYLYYVCNDVSKEGKAASCALRNLPAREFEEFIIETIGQIGQHPEVIAATCRAYQKGKGEAARELKKKISDLEKRRREAVEQVQGLLGLAKREGYEHIGLELLNEADEAAKQKQALEAEIEKTRDELQFRERESADASVIAEALISFKKVFATLPQEKKEEFLRLILRRVSIRRLAGDEAIPRESQCSRILQMRTFRFQVKIQLFTEDLLSTGCEPGSKSSHLAQSGDPYGIRTRITAVKGRCPNP
jgi:site-specific DNA recombinase